MLSLESPKIVRNKQRLDKSRKLKLFPETEDKHKGDLNDVDVYEEDDMSETEQDNLCFSCNRPLPNPRHRPRPRKRQSTSEMNTGVLSPIERMFQHKREEITAKKAEIAKLHKQKDDFIAEIQRAAEYVERVEGDGAKCNNCHLPNHTVKRCENISCKSAKHCGVLKKHKEDRETLEKMDKNINDLLKTVKVIAGTLEKRKMAYISVESLINRQIEEILLGGFHRGQ